MPTLQEQKSVFAMDGVYADFAGAKVGPGDFHWKLLLRFQRSRRPWRFSNRFRVVLMKDSVIAGSFRQSLTRASLRSGSNTMHQFSTHKKGPVKGPFL
jgi:hypothetical protein